MDEHGLVVEALEEQLVAGLRPKFVYVIPEHQNPTGRTLPLERREALVELCRRHGVAILEDVAYRELAWGAEPLPTLWSLAPDVVVQAGTFSKVFFPGVRLGWASGPEEIVAQLAAAKANTDQCASALGQRMVEEYGRGGHFERELPGARALYASHWRALDGALHEHMPDGVAWRSEEHTSELQSHSDLVCRLLLEKKKKNRNRTLLKKKKNNNYRVRKNAH